MSAARPEKCTLTARDREICDAIGPTLREQGMIFVGIDVIGDWLTEINVTSPTGLQEIDRFDGINIEAHDLGPHRGEARRCLIVAGVAGVLAHDGGGDEQERGDTQQIQPNFIDLRFGAPPATNIWFNASSQNAAAKARKKLSRLRTQNRAKNSPLARNPAVTMPARNMLTDGSLIGLPR